MRHRAADRATAPAPPSGDRGRSAGPGRLRHRLRHRADERGGVMAARRPGHGHSRAGRDRRAGVPDPGAEGADPARVRSPRLAERARERVLDPRGVPGRLPATRGRRPRVPRRRGPHPRRPVPGPQEPGGVRLRPPPRPETRPHRPPGHPGLRHRQGERGVPRPARHRQDPPGHRPGDPGLPGRPPGRVRHRRRMGRPPRRRPHRRPAARRAASGSAATRCWSSTRSATSPSKPKPPTCSSSSSPARYERAC